MHSFSFLKGFLQLLSQLETQGGISSHCTSEILYIFIIFSRSLPFHFLFYLRMHMQTHALTLSPCTVKAATNGLLLALIFAEQMAASLHHMASTQEMRGAL